MTYLFNPYTSTPKKTDKNFINPKYGGYSNCIVRDSATGYTLPNCVAFVHGMWLSCITEAVGLETARKIEHDMCWGNAEDYWWYTEDGFDRGQTPKLMAIMVWEGKGSLKGHVMTVTKILDNGDVIATGSDYSGSKFYTKTYYKSKGYDFSSSYDFKGFIYCPYEFTYYVGKTVTRDTTRKQIEVRSQYLRVRQDASTTKWPEGYANQGLYNIYEEAENEGYKWYRIGDQMWVANDKDETWCKVYDEERIGVPVPRNEKVDQFEITASTLNARKAPSLKGEILGYAKKGIYNCEDRATKDGYEWFSSQGFWVAQSKDGKDWVNWLPKKDQRYEMTLMQITEDQRKEVEAYARAQNIVYVVKEV